MSVIETVKEASHMIDRLCEEINDWRHNFADQCTTESMQETAELLEEAYQINKRLRGDY